MMGALGLQTAVAGFNEFSFPLTLSPGIPTTGPLKNAAGQVNIQTVGPVEFMSVTVVGLPPGTHFDFFVIQVPHAPFGLSWYQGDVVTNHLGQGFATFVGRFNIETFIVSPGAVTPAPVVFQGTFPDSPNGVAVGRIHTYHCGLWFDSPVDAANAGAPGTVTPFNGEGNAGVQVLNTGTFQDLAGPLINVN
jgi:hypothetical protein